MFLTILKNYQCYLDLERDIVRAGEGLLRTRISSKPVIQIHKPLICTIKNCSFG